MIFLLVAEKAPKPWAKISLILVPAQHRPWRPDKRKMTLIHGEEGPMCYNESDCRSIQMFSVLGAHFSDLKNVRKGSAEED